MKSVGAEVTFDVPAGAANWAAGGSNFLGLPPFTDPPGAMRAVNELDWVPIDPCDYTVGRTLDPSVEQVVDALVAIPVATVAEPVEVRFGAITGKQVVMDIDDDLGDCDLVIYHIAAPSILRSIGGGQHVELWVLDVAGQPFVIEASCSPSTPETDRAILRLITDSLSVQIAT